MASRNKFADDTKVFGKVMDEKDRGMLQTDLNKLTSWAQKWKMEFNALALDRSVLYFLLCTFFINVALVYIAFSCF